MSTRRDLVAGIGFILLGARWSRAQNQAANPIPTFASDVKVVNVFVTVRDKKGSIVTDLNKEDFLLNEDERPQSIRYFSKQSDLPLTLGLIVDTTPSETKMLGIERDASYSFLEQVLRPDKDRAFLIQFGDEVEMLQDITSSRAKLEKALDLLESHGEAPGRGGGPGRGGSRGGGDSTVLSDAIYLASNDILKSQSGRKALIILGDGDHIGDQEQQAISAAQRADTLVYTIRIYDKDWGNNGNTLRRALNVPGIPGIGGGGPGWGGGPGQGGPGGGPGRSGMPERSEGKKHLQEIASRTGGAFFEVTKNKSLTQIYDEVEKELRNQYSLGYTPEETANSGYRRIRVSLKQSGLTVQAREGYYAPSAS
jgi:VWFA-related protein